MQPEASKEHEVTGQAFALVCVKIAEKEAAIVTVEPAELYLILDALKPASAREVEQSIIHKVDKQLSSSFVEDFLTYKPVP